MQAEFAGGGEAGGVGDVGDDDGDLDARETAFANGLGDGEKVRSAAGEKNPEAKGAGLERDVHDQLVSSAAQAELARLAELAPRLVQSQRASSANNASAASSAGYVYCTRRSPLTTRPIT